MSALLDLLGQMGDVLDTPRQLVWQGISGMAGKDWKGAEDALVDAGMDRDSLLTKGLGFAGDMATDPLTWAGALAGAGGAHAAFSKLGPRYGANAAKLAALEIPEAMAERGGVGMIGEALAHPQASQILHEIPQGSKFLGAGAESLALGTPEGDVLRLSRFDPKSAINFPETPHLNAPTRRQFFGNMEVSRTPLATNVGDEALFNAAKPQLEQGLRSQGVDVFDLKPEDVGLVGGQPKVLDLGSVDLLNNPGGPINALRGQTPGRQLYKSMAGGGAAPRSTSALLRLLGGE